MEEKEVNSMKGRPIFLILAGLVTLTACKPKGAVPESPEPIPTPAATPTPVSTPEPASNPVPSPEPISVQEADVPPGDYGPWQEAYADFLRQLRQEEGELKHWIDTAPDQEINEDMERWVAYNDASEYYSFYDVDKDGIPELFIQYNNCEAGYHTTCYAFRDGQVVEAGEFPSGHSSLYTWPGENALLLFWGHMGSAYMEKYSMMEGILTVQDEIFSESIWGTEQEEYTKPDRLVPGAEYIPVYYSPTHWRPGDSPALLLPIYDYGEYPRKAQPCLGERTVRSVIGKVLWEGAELYGVSGDGFDGDTGWVTLEEYLQPGGAYPYGSEPFTVGECAWADVNGDGQTDCVLHLVKVQDEAWNDDHYAVLSLQDGTVYAYFFGFTDRFGVDPDGSVYLGEYEWWEQVSFYQNQCYTISARQGPVEGCDLAWEEFTPPEPESAPEFSLPKGNYASWQRGYMEFLTGLCEEEEELWQWRSEATKEEWEGDPDRAWAARQLSQHYWLYDVDKNGVPELFVGYGEYNCAPWVECYTYRKGETVQVGKIWDGVGTSLYTWPGENGVLEYWAYKWGFYLSKYSIVDGELVREEMHSSFGEPEPDPWEFVSDTLYIKPCRVSLTRPGGTPMLLPICNYGGRKAAPVGGKDRTAARGAIENVLFREGAFYGVYGTYYRENGVIGWVTLPEYCMKGMASYHAITPMQKVWMDLDGDGEEECVVRFQDTFGNGSMSVFHWQDGVVYAYYMEYSEDALTADGRFYAEEPVFIHDKGCANRLIFHQDQCYFEAVSRPDDPVPAAWEPF